MVNHGGHRAAIKYDAEAGVFHGEVMDTRDVITFQSASAAQLRGAFEDSVDEYLKVCAKRDRNPDRKALEL